MRYRAIEGSQSAHCCFTHTVVDTTKPTIFGAGENAKPYVPEGVQQFESVCECFEQADADNIARALNLTVV